MFAGPGGFNGGVEAQQVGALGDVADELEDAVGFGDLGEDAFAYVADIYEVFGQLGGGGGEF
jgi:hypothetical protein